MRDVDPKKIKNIEKVLKQNPDGVWVREIARKTGLDKSTISIYIKKNMKDKIKTKKMGNMKLVQIKK